MTDIMFLYLQLTKENYITPVPIRNTSNTKCRGKGDYQDTLGVINKLKVLYKLTSKPYSYQLLWNETHVHRNRLRKILDDFEKNKMIVCHKFTHLNRNLFGNETLNPETGLVYFILDLGNKKTLEYLCDSKLDTIVKDNLKLNILYPLAYARKGRKIDPWIGHQSRNYDFYVENKRRNISTEFLKIVRNMDYSFSPLIYLHSDQIFDFERKCETYSYFTSLKAKKPKLYSQYMKVLENSDIFQDSDFDSLNSKDNEYQNMATLITEMKAQGFTNYDILINVSWSYDSRRKYKELWNLMKQY